MDPTTQEPQTYVKENKLKPFIILGTILIIILSLGMFVYFKSPKIYQLVQNTINSNKIQTTSTNSSVQTPSPTPTAQLKLSCPVPEEYCKTGKLTTYKKDPALIYNLPAGTDILSTTEVKQLPDMLVLQNHITNIKSLTVAARDQSSCYFLTYSIPGDTDFIVDNKIDFPIKIGQKVSKVNNNTIEADNQKGNLIIMVRKMLVGSENTCVVWDNPFRESSPYQSLENLTRGLF